MIDISGREVIVSVSGGKDSTAAALWLKEQSIPYRAVHNSTGWESGFTEEYLEHELPKHIGPIEVTRAHEGGMEGLIRKKGMFPSRVRRFCTQGLKMLPFMEWIDQHCLERKPVNVLGIRSEESAARATLGEIEDLEWATIWRPLLKWSFADVIAIHKRHGVPPNPLYTKGSTRVGCWPCIFARKSEIRLIAESDPGRIDRIRTLETDLFAAATARYAARGTTMAELGYTKPTFFVQKRRIEQPDGSAIRKSMCVPIDEVVSWAKTARGGREPELFWEPDRSGCMRWGLCDF